MPIYQVEKLKTDFTSFLKSKFAALDRPVALQTILIGDDFASRKYIQMKLKMASKLGLGGELHEFEFGHHPSELQALIESFTANSDSVFKGVLVQLPVDSEIYRVVQAIPALVDLDLLGLESQQLWNMGFYPPTVGGIDLVLKDILNDYAHLDFQAKLKIRLNLAGLKVAVIGQGLLVGKPLLTYLAEAEATIFSCNIKTQDTAQICRQADIVISATGVKDLIGLNWLKVFSQRSNLTWPIIIDAGTSEGQVVKDTVGTIQSVLVGDADKAAIHEKCTLVGVPGGIGPLTVRYIFYNLYRLAAANFKIDNH